MRGNEGRGRGHQPLGQKPQISQMFKELYKHTLRPLVICELLSLVFFGSARLSCLVSWSSFCVVGCYLLL